jgi:hypothetical protein
MPLWYVDLETFHTYIVSHMLLYGTVLLFEFSLHNLLIYTVGRATRVDCSGLGPYIFSATDPNFTAASDVVEQHGMPCRDVTELKIKI